MGTEAEDLFDDLPAGEIIEEEEECAEEERDEEDAKRLGSLLIRDGKITPDQLESALAKQKQDRRNGDDCFLGRILVEDKAIAESDLICALMKQARLPYLHLLGYEVDPEAVKLVPEFVCRKHLLLPIEKLGRTLTVAMVSPLNETSLEAAKKACPDLQVKRILCGWSELQEVFKRLFNHAEPMRFDLKAKLAKH